MPTKAELYAQMADKVATQLTGSWQEWAGFLTTASRLYKYPFHEQLMIYAQRPDATACAEYDLWNEKMGRYVRRGSKGIALVDDSGDRPRLRYVFDISDTGTREHSRTPWLWQLEERHLDSVQAMLERTYDVSGDDLAGQLTEVAGKLAEEYWTEHQQDFFYIVDGSFLEEYDEYNIGVQFKAAATVSITYALMSRCGLEPERYFDHEDFMAIFDFNTRPPSGRWEQRSARSTSRCCGRSALPSEMQSAKPTKKGASKMNNPMTYIQNGDYQIPDLKLSQQPEKPLGKYGRMRKTYLKEHRPILYNQMLLSEKLYPHLLEIDETAQSRLEQMMPQLTKKAGATEELKASDPMKWVGLMNTCKAQAEEILMAELINS